MRIKQPHLSLSLAACMMLCGCINLDPQTDPARFYILSSQTGPTTSSDNSQGTVLGLKAIALPAYLQSRRIPTRRGANEVTYSEYHRWGESPKSAISRVLAENLASHSAIGRVHTVPWPDGAIHDFELHVTLVRFEGEESGRVALEASWAIFNPDDDSVLRNGSTTVNHLKWNGRDYSALARSLGEALVILANDLAAAIADLEKSALISSPVIRPPLTESA